MLDITVVIATYNRPQLLINAISSVLNQEYKNFIFVVSDNSSNNDTFYLLKEKGLLDKFEYRKKNNLLAYEHFNEIVAEIKTKYFVMFHDDDIMFPNMLGALYDSISSDESLIAVGCNNYFFNGDEKARVMNLKKSDDLLFSSKEDIIPRYFGNTWKAVPFPSYIYNVEMIREENIIYTTKAGKYSDVIWLMDLVEVGRIKWLAEPLMLYRIHPAQDSGQFSFCDYHKLLRYVAALSDSNSSLILNFRIKLLYTAMVNKLSIRLSAFSIKQVALLYRYSPSYYLPKYIKILFIKIIKRTLKKCKIMS